MPTDGASRGAAVSPRCVLWHPERTDPPIRLVESLSRRGVWVKNCTSPMLALAHACRLEMDRLSSHGDAARISGDGVVLLLVEPERLSRARDVVRTLSRIAPGVGLWRYEASGTPILAAVTASELNAWTANGAPKVTVRPDIPEIRPRRTRPAREAPAPPPTLRLVGDGPSGPRGGLPLGESESEADHGSLLTREELEMLLSEDSGEHHGHDPKDDR